MGVLFSAIYVKFFLVFDIQNQSFGVSRYFPGFPLSHGGSFQNSCSIKFHVGD